jgi:primosomal protein N' (replication factor Y)
MARDSNAERTVPVMIPVPTEGCYSYSVAPEQNVGPGSVVAVPLGSRTVPGIVWDGAAGVVGKGKLRAIEQVFDCPPIGDSTRRFVDWVARYTLSAPGMVARLITRVPAAFDPETPLAALRWNGAEPERMTAARGRVLELSMDGMAWTRTGLARSAGVSPSVVDGLVSQGIFEAVHLPPPPVVARPDPDYGGAPLAGGQEKIAAALRARAGSGFSVTLLDGVTGAGKTEVYFEAVAEALRNGTQVLILLPEIALTHAFLSRFEERFGSRPAEWHSDLAPRMRERVWRQVIEGQVRVVAGARSALFLPFPELGAIIVDEEHDQAYKQEEGICYNARDMAIVRARITDIPIVLSSATPSIESRVNAERGRYERLVLPSRFAEAALPDLKCIDLKRFAPPRGQFLSPVLTDHIAKTLERGEQSLLFLNRRGYAPLTLCRVCGHRFQCPDCTAWLVEHRFRGQLVCHHCGHHESRPEACPECGTLDHLVACGPGIERIAEEIVAHFPDARTIVLSSDLPGGVKRLRLELEAIADGESDIVIGTQLVAKGHNFPNMTLVGVVDADIGLSNGDPRAAERTYQLLNQVTGRAGRTGKQSLGLVQTYYPEHPVMRAIVSGDAESFYQREIAERERGHLPPFSRLAALVISAASRAEAENHARALRSAAPAADGIDVLGPAEAPLAVVRGRHRFRLLVQAGLGADIQEFVRSMIAGAARPRGSVRVNVDIDPMSFL